MASVAQADLPINVDALAEILADHLNEPTYCLGDEGEAFTRFTASGLRVSESGNGATVILTAENGQTFELTVRQTP